MREEAEAKAVEAEEAKVRRHAEIQAEVEIEKARQLAEIQNRPTEKIQWNGTDRELGEWFLELWQKGQIKAESSTAVFELASRHFCKKDGSAFKAHNLYVNLKGKRDFTKEGPAPAAPKPTQR
jgi:hypothetical protein